MNEYLTESGKALIYYGLENGADPNNKHPGQDNDGYLKINFRQATYYFRPGGLYVLNNTTGELGSPDADMLLHEMGNRGLAKIDYDLFFGGGFVSQSITPAEFKKKKDDILEELEKSNAAISKIILEAKIQCYIKFMELIDNTKIQYDQRQLERQEAESGHVTKEKYESWLSEALSKKSPMQKKVNAMTEDLEKGDFSKIEIPKPEYTPWTVYSDIPTPMRQFKMSPVVSMFKEHGMAKPMKEDAAFEFSQSNKGIQE